MSRSLLMALVSVNANPHDQAVATWLRNKCKMGDILQTYVTHTSWALFDQTMSRYARANHLFHQTAMKIRLEFRLSKLLIEIDGDISTRYAELADLSAGFNNGKVPTETLELIDVAAASFRGLTLITKRTADLTSLSQSASGCDLVDPWAGESF